VALNATQWLAGGGSGGGGGGGGGGTGTERVTNGGFESGISGWTASGSGAVTTARAHSGTHSDAPCATVNCTSTLTQSVVLPAGSHGALTFWTYVTTQESGTKVWDTLVAKVNGSTVATVSNASPHGAWFETTVDLASYAGQTISLSLAEKNDAELPTSFYLDDVSVLA
jgi:kumamolisin